MKSNDKLQVSSSSFTTILLVKMLVLEVQNKFFEKFSTLDYFTFFKPNFYHSVVFSSIVIIIYDENIRFSWLNCARFRRIDQNVQTKAPNVRWFQRRLKKSPGVRLFFLIRRLSSSCKNSRSTQIFGQLFSSQSWDWNQLCRLSVGFRVSSFFGSNCMVLLKVMQSFLCNLAVFQIFYEKAFGWY